jgi:hypothetical protein
MPGVRREKSGKSAERLARSESSVFLMVASVNGIALSTALTLDGLVCLS